MILLLATTLLVFSMVAWLVSDRTPLPGVADHPNQRSLHASPVPHTGGVAIVVGIGLAWAWHAVYGGWPQALGGLVFAMLLVASISFLDDLKDIPPLVRLLVHALAAAVLVFGGLSLPGISGLLLAWLGIIWMMNLFNFMDGMDGLAGGMAVFGFGFLGLAGWLSGDAEYVQIVWTVSAASLGFLVLNLPPARIFMGDIGAVTLGLLVAACSLWGYDRGIFPLWYPVLLFSPFIVDASVTLLRRLWRREQVWRPHREHCYQRLVLAGYSQRTVLLWEYLFMLLSGASGLWLLYQPLLWQVGILSAWVVVYALLLIIIELKTAVDE